MIIQIFMQIDLINVLKFLNEDVNITFFYKSLNLFTEFQNWWN